MVCLSINPYVVTSSPYVFQSLCYSHKVHMTWIQLLPTYLISKPLLVHSVFFQAQMLTQWWPGVWPFNLPSCLSLSVSVIPQHFSWDKECCWVWPHMTSWCTTSAQLKPKCASCWFSGTPKPSHLQALLFFFFISQILVLILCGEKSWMTVG